MSALRDLHRHVVLHTSHVRVYPDWYADWHAMAEFMWGAFCMTWVSVAWAMLIGREKA